jgi:predicted transcriptional regulator
MTKRRAESREGMIVTTVALDPELHRALAIAALEEIAATAEIMREAVREWLATRAKRKKR